MRSNRDAIATQVRRESQEATSAREDRAAGVRARRARAMMARVNPVTPTITQKARTIWSGPFVFLGSVFTWV